MLRFLTLLVAIAFILLAAVGMIPGAALGGKLFGFLTASYMNQLFYFVLGLLGLLSCLKGRTAPKIFLFSAGLVLTLLGLAGFFYDRGLLLYFLTVGTGDNVFHLIMGLILLYLGVFFSRKKHHEH